MTNHKAPPPTPAHPGTGVFLLFSFLTAFGAGLLDPAFKFVIFDVTQSRSLLSLAQTLDPVISIVLFCFVGTIIDMYSRKFFVYLGIVVMLLTALILYATYNLGLLTIWLLVIAMALEVVRHSLASPASNSVFYDLCGTEKLSLWISRNKIVLYAAALLSTWAVSFLTASPMILFLLYLPFQCAALLAFRAVGYQDQNQKQSFSSFGEGLRFVGVQLKDFVAACRTNPNLLSLFAFSFVKTLFIFWPMAIGALLKFGVEGADTRRTYMLAMAVVQFASGLSAYLLGRVKGSFSPLSFVIGAGISGVGILLLSLTNDAVLSTLALVVMYVGMVLSAQSASYILRMELPEQHRTQGLGFSVVPYYTADLISGVIFTILMGFCSVDQLLFCDGLILTVLCVIGALALFLLSLRSIGREFPRG